MDTIRLIDITIPRTNPPKPTINDPDFLNGHDYVSLSFNKNFNLQFLSYNIKQWTNTRTKGKYNWNFDEKKQILNLYFKNRIIGSFKPIFENIAEIQDAYKRKPPRKTKEVILVRSNVSPRFL